MKNQLTWPVWEHLGTEERRKLLEQIGKQYGMTLLGEETFARWGKETHSARFRRGESEFVFVPGDTVTLGWETFVQGMNEEDLEQIQEELENLDLEETVEEFLQERTSPVRQETIGPMLVERTLQTIGYEEVSLDDPRFTGNPEWVEALARAKREGYTGMTIAGEIRFAKEETGWRAELCRKEDFSQLKEKLAAQGFSLPTISEWEYLCGGGCRTFFPWGDSLEKDLCLRHFEEPEDDRSYDLEEPNFFGLSIAYDPYRLELTLAPDGAPARKGGDGGCNICGGADPVMGYLPCAPYFQYEAWQDEEELDNDFDFYRRILRVELEGEG